MPAVRVRAGHVPADTQLEKSVFAPLPVTLSVGIVMVESRHPPVVLHEYVRVYVAGELLATVLVAGVIVTDSQQRPAPGPVWPVRRTLRPAHRSIRCGVSCR